jgi:hypothetical protein
VRVTAASCVLIVLLALFFYPLTASFQFCAYLMGLTLLAVLPSLKSAVRNRAFIVCGANAGLLLLVHLSSFSPKKPFMWFYNSIEIGMSKDGVETSLPKYFPPNGKFHVPREKIGNGAKITWGLNEAQEWPDGENKPDQSLLFVLDPSDGGYDSEIIEVYLRREKVISKNLSGD